VIASFLQAISGDPMAIGIFNGRPESLVSLFLTRYAQRHKHQTHKDEVPELQGKSPGEAQRNELPGVRDQSPDAREEGYETESLTRPKILCRLGCLECQQSHDR
jgi:hypothetical protein